MKLEVPGREKIRLLDAYHWKELVRENPLGYFELKTEDIGEVPVRMFLTEKLLGEVEDGIYPQIVNATKFPGVKLVAITPDCHIGYGVPVGSVILTDAVTGSVAMGPVGYDIGCVDGATEYLSPGGWRQIDKYDGGPVMQYDPISGEGGYVQPERYIVLPCKEFLHFKTKNGIDQVLSPEHRVLFWRDKEGKKNNEVVEGEVITAQELANEHNHLERGVQGSFEGSFVVGLPTTLPIEDELLRLQVMGMLEGRFIKKAKNDFVFRITLTQKRKIERAQTLLIGAKWRFSQWYLSKGKRMILQFEAPLPTKSFDNFWLSSLHQLDIITDECLYWKGEEKGKVFCTNDRVTADFIQYAFTASGKRANLKPYVKPDGKVDYRVLLHAESKVSLSGGKKIRIGTVPSKDQKKYCFTLPTGFWVMRRDGNVVMTGNCGMISASSKVPWEQATPDKKLRFNRAVMEEVAMGAGESSGGILSRIDKKEFQNLVRGGANYYATKYGQKIDRTKAERQCIPVDDSWQIPWGGAGRPERGVSQLGSLGGGNHFIELQRSNMTETLFVQVHTGSRGFGHGMASNYFTLAKAEKPDEITQLDLGYFTPESEHYKDYLNAVACGANFAIVNRLVIFEQVARAFRKVFNADLELIYEISHNLVQKEWHPEFGEVFVHRKGATRALPAGHPQLIGSPFYETGHPILIPGSNKDFSYILKPEAGASKSGFSVNHGAGRRLSRGEAKRTLTQSKIDREYKEANILVNTNGKVPLDEAGPCYKSSREVIEAVTNAGLASVVHELWPLASLKAI